MPRISRLVTALALAAALGACKPAQPATNPAVPPPVTVAKPLHQDVTAYYQTTGTTSASLSVNLVARVEGYLQEIKFTDGTFVKKGQSLFMIEPEPYAAKLHLSEAQLSQANAELKGAQIELDRQQRMIKENSTAQANVDKWQTNRDAAAATVQQAQANVELAKIDLGYTQVVAPFDGRVGRHLVDPGNIVGTPGPTTLATIEQVAPLYIYFNASESDFLKVRAVRAKAGQLEQVATPVEIGVHGEDGYPHAATLDFLDTGVDTGTGTIQVRATLGNTDHALVPGLFARLRIPLGAPAPALLVPDTVVGHDQIGAFLLVVGADNTVSRRQVETGPLSNGLRVIAKGLAADDAVVVNGLQNALPGRKVTPVSQPPVSTAAATN